MKVGLTELYDKKECMGVLSLTV